jgi:hypothetical protein
MTVKKAKKNLKQTERSKNKHKSKSTKLDKGCFLALSVILTLVTSFPIYMTVRKYMESRQEVVEVSDIQEISNIENIPSNTYIKFSSKLDPERLMFIIEESSHYGYFLSFQDIDKIIAYCPSSQCYDFIKDFAPSPYQYLQTENIDEFSREREFEGQIFDKSFWGYEIGDANIVVDDYASDLGIEGDYRVVELNIRPGSSVNWLEIGGGVFCSGIFAILTISTYVLFVRTLVKGNLKREKKSSK